jgi:hypothetical protein
MNRAFRFRMRIKDQLYHRDSAEIYRVPLHICLRRIWFSHSYSNPPPSMLDRVSELLSNTLFERSVHGPKL